MPVIPYTIQRSVRKIINGKQRWFYEYEPVFVDVNDAVAAFLGDDDKRERRYQWKIKKQKQDANIHTVFSLDEIGRTSDSEEYLVADLIEDTVNQQNRDPLDIIIDKEERKESKKRSKELSAMFKEMYSTLLTKKQYEAWEYSDKGYNTTEIAKLLNIDESSVRERLENAFKRINKDE